MNTWPVPDALHSKYHGSGYALAAVSGGSLVSFVYLEDVLPDFDPDAPHATFMAANDDRLGSIVLELSALGDVSFGMLGGYEFTEL